MQLNQALLQHAADAAGLTYIEIDFKNGAVRTSDNFLTVMGFVATHNETSLSETGPRLLLDHVVSRDRSRVECALKEIMSGFAVGKIEYAVLGDDQVERFIESAWTIHPGSDGKPLKAFATNLNITERKQADKAMRSSEEFSRAVLESSSDCVKTLDGAGRIISLNKNGLCLLEIDDFSSWQGMNWRELWPEETQPLLNDALAKAQRGEVARFQAFLPTVKGTPKWWDVIVAPVLNGEEPIDNHCRLSRHHLE